MEAMAQLFRGFRRNTDGIPLDFNALFRYTKEVSGDDTPQILPIKEPETAMKISRDETINQKEESDDGDR